MIRSVFRLGRSIGSSLWRWPFGSTRTALAAVPGSDRTTGGAAITLVGAGFVAGAKVTFGGMLATSVVVVSSTTITCVAPAHAAGVVEIVVTNSDSTAISNPTGFVYYTPAANPRAIVATLNGASFNVLSGSLSLQLARSRSTASFRTQQTANAFGALRIGVGSCADADLLFCGEIENPGVSYVGTPANVWRSVTAVSNNAKFRRRLVWARYTDVPADEAARDLIAKHGAGFTGVNVQSGLPHITAVFTGDDLDACFTELRRQINGGYYVDLSNDVHFTDGTPEAVQPTALPNAMLRDDPPASFTPDSAQYRNRVFVLGADTKLLADVAPTETILPIDTMLFEASGGQVASDDQIVSYTGVQNATQGALVGPGVRPDSAPSIVVVTGSGISPGLHQLAYTWVTGSGETTPSPLSAQFLAQTYTPPTPTVFGLIADAHAAYNYLGGNLQIGATYEFALANVSTTLGVRSGLSTPSNAAVAVASINNASIAAPILLSWTGITHDSRTDAIAVFCRKNGGAWNFLDALNLGSSAKFFYQDSIGSDPYSSSINLFKAQATVALGPGGTTQRKIYMTASGGSQLKLAVTVANNTTTGPIDITVADGSLGANAPTVDTSGLNTTNGQVNATDTSILCTAPPPFTEGWAIFGNQAVRYTGVTGNTLTGVPAAGPGALTASVRYGTVIEWAKALTGVTGLVQTRLSAAGTAVAYDFSSGNNYGFTTAGAYTVQVTQAVSATVFGVAGGGAPWSTSHNQGSGGAGGGESNIAGVALTLQPGKVYVVIVGAAGVPGASGTSAGTAGGQSSITNTTDGTVSLLLNGGGIGATYDVGGTGGTGGMGAGNVAGGSGGAAAGVAGAGNNGGNAVNGAAGGGAGGWNTVATGGAGGNGVVSGHAQSAGTGGIGGGVTFTGVAGEYGSGGGGALGVAAGTGVGAGAQSGAIVFRATTGTMYVSNGVSVFALALLKNAPVTLYAQRDNIDAQQQTAQTELDVFGNPTDGIHAFRIPKDTALISQTLVNARGDADLDIYSVVNGTLAYVTTDRLSIPGAMVPSNLSPIGAVGDFTIQSASVSVLNNSDPVFSVTASTIRASIEDVMRQILQRLAKGSA